MKIFTLYHEAPSSELKSILASGLKQRIKREKGSKPLIAETNHILDKKCPNHLKSKNLSREYNLYAYIPIGDRVIDIKDGTLIQVSTFVQQNTQNIIKINVDPVRCFVSDLDAFDALKLAIKQKYSHKTISNLAKSYWGKIIPLNEFELGAVYRPEAMITYDVTKMNLEAL